MSFWRSHRRHLLVLSLLLVIFILLMDPLTKKDPPQTYNDGHYVDGFEAKQRNGQNQEKPEIKNEQEEDVADQQEMKVQEHLGTSDRKAEEETEPIGPVAAERHVPPPVEDPAAARHPNQQPVGPDAAERPAPLPIRPVAAERPAPPPAKLPKPIVPLRNPNTWQRHLKKECEKFHMYDPLTEKNFNKDLFKHILVDDKHKVIYCQIPKVATITWRRIFIISTGLANTSDPKALPAIDIYGKYDKILKYLSDMGTEEIKYRLRNYFKFVFVREPMERLLSAYRNKMVSKMASSDYFRKVLGKKIAMEYRAFSENGKIDPEDPDVLFKEFAQYLTDHNRKIQWNEHWDKYHNLCFPCTIPYDYVGKLENAQKDANYILQRTGLDKIALFPNRNDTSYKLEETKNILKQYYSTLTRSDLRNLVREYEIDRQLFSYKLPEVVNNILHPR